MVRMERSSFGRMLSGEEIELFTAANRRGTRISFTNYGGIITAIVVPDRDGVSANIALHYDSLQGYIEGKPFVGTLIGRHANRIAAGRFTLDGVEYRLPLNDGPNHLHGGDRGFHRTVWAAAPFEGEAGSGAVLTYTSPAGEEGYPGTLQAEVTYTLTDENEFIIDYLATTDAPTPVNLTSHIYFNLSGDAGREIDDHELTLNSSSFAPVSSTQIPTGEVVPVAGTPFDFTTATRIGARSHRDDPQLRYAGGTYDHNWVLDRAESGLAPAARLLDPTSGRVLEVETTEPGIQVFTGFPDAHAIALETQHFPDAPNQPNFPSTILRPGDVFRSRTIYRMSVEEDL